MVAKETSDYVDLYISYESDQKSQVENLAKKLADVEITVFHQEDEKAQELWNPPSVEHLAKTIRKGKIFLCCLTNKYLNSKVNGVELKFASDNKRPIIILELEKIDSKKLSEITSNIKIECFKKTWSNDCFQSIEKEIKGLKEANKKARDKYIFKHKYQIVETISESEFSVEFLVQDKSENKLKMLRRYKNIDISEMRVKKEAKALKTIDHANVIKYLDFFTDKMICGKVLFIVTEFYESGTLEKEISLRKETNSLLPISTILEWSNQLISAIYYLHSKDLVHANVNPSNICFSNGQLILGDLGHEEAQTTLFYKAKISKFALSYTAPELVRRSGVERNPENLNQLMKIDIWSLGCIIYEMLKLKRLFNGDNLREIENMIIEFHLKSLNLADVDSEILNIIEKSLINEPSKRASSSELCGLEMPSKKDNESEKSIRIEEEEEKDDIVTHTKKKEILTIHLGQPGIEAGRMFWDLVCAEHKISFDGKLENPSEGDPLYYPFFTRLRNRYSPRAIFVDTDPTFIEELRFSSYKSLLNQNRINQLICGKSSCSSIYALGHNIHGRELIDEVLDSIKFMIEDVSNLDGFLIFASPSGGMSGFKSLLLERLSEEYSKQTKVEVAIAPLAQFVLAPYNSVLQLNSSLEHLNSSILIDNQAVYNATKFNNLSVNMSYKNVNKLIAKTLNAITSTFRYESNINSSLSQLVENVNVSPKLIYQNVSYSHINRDNDFHSYTKLRQYLLESKNQLSEIDFRRGKFISNSFTHMGATIDENEINELMNIDKQSSKSISFDGKNFSAGFSKQPNKKLAGCMLTSSTAITDGMFKKQETKFDLMYSKRAFVHWYLGYGMEESQFSEARQDLAALMNDYKKIDA